VKYGTAGRVTHGNIVRRMRILCCITKGYRPTLGIFNAYCFSTAKVVTRKRLIVISIRTLTVLSIQDTVRYSLSMRILCCITKGYRPTLGIFNAYCFSTAKVVTRKRLIVISIRTLADLFIPDTVRILTKHTHFMLYN